MAIIVADTDVLIDFLAGADPGSEAVAHHLELGNLSTTVITRFELLCGARTKKQEHQIKQLLRTLPTLLLGESAADSSAAIRNDLRAAGKEIGMADSLIAGIVLNKDCILLTRNRKHFEPIDGLKLV